MSTPDSVNNLQVIESYLMVYSKLLYVSWTVTPQPPQQPITRARHQYPGLPLSPLSESPVPSHPISYTYAARCIQILDFPRLCYVKVLHSHIEASLVYIVKYWEIIGQNSPRVPPWSFLDEIFVTRITLTT